MVLEGHRGHVCGLWLQPSQQGSNVWTGADDGLIRRWDIHTVCVCMFMCVSMCVCVYIYMEVYI